MRSLSSLSFVFVLGFAMAGGPAQADIAPPDRCNGSAGSACSNAGPTYNGPGICTNDTCSRTLPPVNGGAPMTMTYACKTCKAASADAGADVAPAADGPAAGDAALDGVAGDAPADVSSGAGGKARSGGTPGADGSAGSGGTTGAGGATPTNGDSDDACAYVGRGGRSHVPATAVLGLALLGAVLRRRSRRR
jgi:hypothetical protein